MQRNSSSRRVTETFGFMCWHGIPTQMPRAHSHLEIEANLVQGGSISYLFGGTRVEVGEGEWAIFWGSVPHQLFSSQQECQLNGFTLPLARFLGWDLPRALVQAVLNGTVVKEKANLERDLKLFADWECDLQSGQSTRARIAELEIEARLRRLALNLELTGTHFHVPNVGELATGELGHIERMSAFMAQNYADAIKTSDVARAAQIHPNYAMNLFKREFGLSIGEFLTRTRLSHAQRLLATTDKKLLDIAFSCGFGSASRFHAAFKTYCSQTPADYRKCLRG